MQRLRLAGTTWLRLTVFATGILFASTAGAQDSEQPDYPRVNLAPSYKVDADWPQRPDGVEWGQMPGVGGGGRGKEGLFTRADPPVQVYTPQGKFVRGWGADVIGTAHHIKFDHEGRVWLADIGKHVVRQFTPKGKLLKTFGTPGEAGNNETHLNKPTDMAVTPSGEVFVADGYGNNRIVHFDAEGNFVKEWGELGTGPGEFSLPHAIARDSQGRLYVADRNNVRVQVFDESGRFLDEWRNVIVPWGFWVTDSDEIWVCGSSPQPWRPDDVVLGCPPKDQVFMKFTTEGKLMQLWTVPIGQEPGKCDWVHGIALDSAGNIYVGDIMGERAQKFVRHEESDEGRAASE